jgi:threonine 3-dehydrogenase
VRDAFPEAPVTFEPDLKRQSIVDSWPIDVDDSAARRDWGWSPEYDLDRAFDEYLIPAVTRRYRQG